MLQLAKGPFRYEKNPTLVRHHDKALDPKTEQTKYHGLRKRQTATTIVEEIEKAWLDKRAAVKHCQKEMTWPKPKLHIENRSSVQFSSAQDGIYALGKAHMRFTPSLRSFPNVALERVPMLVLLTMALSRPLKEDRWALPLSTPLFSRR